MASDNVASNREQLEAAIAAQESLRSTLGDAVVDATIAALRTQLDQLTEVEHQRKLVTVLFMDVVGSTNLMRGRDPEETMAIMDSALARLAAPVDDHGGRVTRFMGDGFMAVFGLPTARENDPEMAIRSGLAILDVAKDLAVDLETEKGITGFDVRVGINTGLVVTGGVTEAEDTIMGDAVNLAARLESAAPTGGVLMSDSTRRHVRGLFQVEDRGFIEAKGFPEPVAVHRVLGRTSAEDRDSERGIEGLEIPMIGRHEELQRVLSAFQLVSTGRALRTVTVVGEAGLGKSRLLREVGASLASIEHLRLAARAMLESQDLPYALIRNMVERRYGIRNQDEAGTARDKLVAGVIGDLGADSEGELKAHFIGQLIGYDFSESDHVRASLGAPQQIRSRAIMYLTEIIAALALEQPVVIAFEDLHWADTGSLDVIDGLLEGLPERPVLVVAATRPSVLERRPGWGQIAAHEWVRLEPLTEHQSAELAAAALRKVIDCPDDLRQRLIEHAEGNPYYLEETVRMLVDDGLIAPRGDVWTVDRERLPEMRIPATLTGVIQARLDALARPERVTLQQASVVGRIFWDAVVDYLGSHASDRVDVASALNALGNREMIHERASSEFSGAAEYLFHHEILRGVAYEGVLIRVRRIYHSLAADWLIEKGGDRAAEMTGLIAAHLEQAGRDFEALEYFSKAADMASAAHAVEIADKAYERALALTPADDVPRRFDLLLGRAKTTGMQGQRNLQRSILDELEELAGDDAAAATVAIERTWFHWFTGGFLQAVEASADAVDAAQRTNDPGLEAQARYALAMSLVAAEDPYTARSEAELALRLARDASDDNAAVRAHNALGMVALAVREYSTARRHLTASMQTARNLENLERELTAANNLGIVETQLGNYQVARQHFHRNRQLAAEVGDWSAEASALVNLAWVSASEGRWPQARDLAERAVARKREVGHADAVAEGLMWLGHALFGLGEVEAARDAYSEALQIRDELDQTALAMGARAGVARTALALGHLEAAVSEATRVCRYLDDGGNLAGTWEPLRIHLTCGEVLRAAGKPEADRVLDRARRLLLADAERISDDADRTSFLGVSWHRRIIELAGDGSGR